MKVGDIVKIKENLEIDGRYGDEIFVDDMKKYHGKQARITNIGIAYELDIDNGRWAWSADMLEPISSKKYEVIIEENTVTVKDSKGNKGIARCSPEDELSTGISIAVSRLKWKPSYGEEYFTINFSEENIAKPYKWINDSFDNTLYERGLVFKTEEEAEKVAKIMLDSISRR